MQRMEINAIDEIASEIYIQLTGFVFYQSDRIGTLPTRPTFIDII